MINERASERQHSLSVICGLNEDGVQFMEEVHPIEISPAGACLSGITRALIPGQLITFHCGEFMGCLRVMWAGEPGSSREGLVGLRWANYTRAPLSPFFLEHGDNEDLEVALTVQ
jgi:hypothetical protein